MANRFKEKEAKVKAQAQAHTDLQKSAEVQAVQEHSLVTAGKIEKKESADAIVIVAEKAETRSKRVNLLVKPSVHEASLKKCQKLGISLNECINQFLEKWSVE